jgi:hypothetical protein
MIFPSEGSRQSTRHCTGSFGVDAMPQVENDITPPMPLGLSALGPTAVVRKIRPPETIGCDHPAPGMAVRQARWSVLLHCAGTLPFGASPWAMPPRNCGHSSADAIPLTNRLSTIPQRSIGRMTIPFIAI